MSAEDEWKIYALRQHIFKISQLQLKYPPTTTNPSYSPCLPFSFVFLLVRGRVGVLGVGTLDLSLTFI
jgi:hypothetical protein